MRFLRDEASARIDRILAADTEDFVELVRVAGLSPAEDFRGTLLRGVDFGQCDLQSFDFTGSIFESCSFRGARISGADFAGAAFTDCDPAEALDWTPPVTEKAKGVAKPSIEAGPALARSPEWQVAFDAASRKSNLAQLPLPTDVFESVRGWHVRCLCEVTNFAQLRRRLGEPDADLLVRNVAQHIRAFIHDSSIGFAGRSLIEVVFQRSTLAFALAELESLRQEFLSPFEALQLQMSFGAAAAPAGIRDDVRLAEEAEIALEQARGESRVVLTDLSQAGVKPDMLSLMHELPRAIANGELFIAYQPKVHLRREQVVAAEALVRWSHPDHGSIWPGDFIAAAEDGGEIGNLTLWMLRQAIHDQRRLAAGGAEIPIYINISAVLLTDPGFVAEARSMITSTGAKIGFEITETAVIRDPDSAIRHLQSFSEIGIPLAIDDYGTGLSSLAYLKRLPATELKIDKMFVMQLTSSNRDPLIVRSTIDLAHALEMEVTAEGVETPEALALLATMGCDMVQGYLISRPLTCDKLLRFVVDRTALLQSKPFYSRA